MLLLWESWEIKHTIIALKTSVLLLSPFSRGELRESTLKHQACWDESSSTLNCVYCLPINFYFYLFLHIKPGLFICSNELFVELLILYYLNLLNFIKLVSHPTMFWILKNGCLLLAASTVVRCGKVAYQQEKSYKGNHTVVR